jgi:ribosomal protein L7/L12
MQKFSDRNAVIAECRRRRDLGAKTDEVIQLLRECGFTLVESIKAVMVVYALPLKEAKRTVAESTVWSREVQAAQPLHDDLERIFRGDESTRPANTPPRGAGDVA